MLVHLVLENTGTEPFTFAHGGDYRSSSRAQRYRVTMTDEAGREVEDPYPPPQMNMGGLGQDAARLPPGRRWTHSLPLLRYRAPDHAGRYTVRVTHDFGWKETPGLGGSGSKKSNWRTSIAEAWKPNDSNGIFPPFARLQPVPRATARVARQAFPHGNAYLHMRDELGNL